MAMLLEHIAEFCLTQGLDRTYLIAFSGGLDSTVLLHLFHETRKKLPVFFKVIHVNHQLNPAANTWMKHVENKVAALHTEMILETITLTQSNRNIEKKARDLRYQVISKYMDTKTILMTAHHLDDQAETFLLQLFRGAGPKGLSSSPYIKKFSDGFHARPLLSFSRKELLQYATENHLNWIEDESNHNQQLTRNFIRQEVMPLLQMKWPTIAKTLARSASHCAAMQNFVDEMCRQQMGVDGSLSIKYLQTLTQQRQSDIIRYWLNLQGVLLPSTSKLQQIIQTVLPAAPDKCPEVKWGQMVLRRYRDQLFVMKNTTSTLPEKLTWDFALPLSFANLKLSAKKVMGRGLHLSFSSVGVKFRQGGEKIQLPRRQHHHSLKKLFQTWQIPPWERSSLPLIFIDDQLAAIPGYFVGEKFQAAENEMGWEIEVDKIN